jgi:penicillin-binding protein 1A
MIGEVTQDLVIDTTIDLTLEKKAEEVLAERLEKEGGKLNASQAALVSIDATGAIRALVGGRDYADEPVQPRRQGEAPAGLGFQALRVCGGTRERRPPMSMVNDTPVKIGNWSPENFDEKYRGPVTLASAFAQSLNTVAAQLAMQVGPDKVVSLAHRLGIDSDIQANASIALGTSEVSLVELTSCLRILHERRLQGDAAYRQAHHRSGWQGALRGRLRQPAARAQRAVAATMNGMMNRVINEGTGKAARIDGWQAAGKSGTTQSFRDALFVGYTSIMTTGIWFGNDDGAFMKKVTGGGLPAKAWKEYMTSAMKGYTPTPLFGTGRGLDLPPPAAVQPDSPSTTIGDIISGILPGGRRTPDELPADYPPAPRPPAQDSASIEREPARVRPVYGDNQGYDNRDNGQIYDNRPVYGDRGRRGDVIPPGDVPVRDYRQYRGPYDSSAPVPPGAIGGGPVPPGDVGVAGSRDQPRQTTLFDLIMGQ